MPEGNQNPPELERVLILDRGPVGMPVAVADSAGQETGRPDPFDQTRSMTVAEPMPPAAHMATTP